MNVEFFKYQGTGNDFIMLNGINNPEYLLLDKAQVKSLCDRRFGIGADGLIILASSNKADFKMIYFNSDGGESTMCGNGGRCIAQFAFDQDIVSTTMIFEAIDGLHDAVVNQAGKTVELHMIDVIEFKQVDDGIFVIDTGSPHYIKFDPNFDDVEIVEFGRKVRYSEAFSADGINVNLSTYVDDKLHVKTYERGVEDETYSCGTGVTAAALCASQYLDLKTSKVNVQSKGGDLSVKFEKQGNGFTNIWLCGPATFVFKGHKSLQ